MSRVEKHHKIVTPTLATFHAQFKAWAECQHDCKVELNDDYTIFEHDNSYLFVHGKWHKFHQGKWVELGLSQAEKQIKFDEAPYCFSKPCANNSWRNTALWKLYAMKNSRNADCPMFVGALIFS